MQKTPLNAAQRTRGTNQMLVSRNVTRFVSGAGNLKPLLQMIEAQRVARRDAEIPARLPTDFWPDWLPSVIRAIAPPMGTRPQRCKDAEMQREKKKEIKRWVGPRHAVPMAVSAQTVPAGQGNGRGAGCRCLPRSRISFREDFPLFLSLPHVRSPGALPGGNCYGKRPACRWTRSPCSANSR